MGILGKLFGFKKSKKEVKRTAKEPRFEFSSKVVVNPLRSASFERKLSSNTKPEVKNEAESSKEVEESVIMDTTASPNATLSRFFAEKGDKPLSNVELEGVLSLIGKSVSSAPSVSPANDLQISLSPVVEQRQPEFHRVVPYDSIAGVEKNRIKSPLLNISRTPAKVTKPVAPKAQKTKLSTTANALLSILDQDLSKSPEPVRTSSFQDFANPYASTPSILLSAKKKRSTPLNTSSPIPIPQLDSSTPVATAPNEIIDLSDSDSETLPLPLPLPLPPVTLKSAEIAPKQPPKQTTQSPMPLVAPHKPSPAPLQAPVLSRAPPQQPLVFQNTQELKTEDKKPELTLNQPENSQLQLQEFIFPVIAPSTTPILVDEAKVAEYEKLFVF